MAARHAPSDLEELRRRKQAIKWYLRGLSFTEICERLDRHSTWLSKWIKRYQAEGWEGLRERSRRPHRLRAQTPDSVVNEILALRKFLETFQDAPMGAAEIRRIFVQRHGTSPSISTIERVLRRRNADLSRRRAS